VAAKTAPLQVGTAVAIPGKKQFGVLDVGETNDGVPIQIPIGIVNGTAPGPVLWLQGGVHGTEYVGMGAIQWVLQGIDPSELKGVIVCVPMVNILAYRAGARGAPQDGMDANRTYPGKPLAEAMHVHAHTEMMVHKLFSFIKEHADYVVDCHDGGWFMTMAPFAQYLAGETEWEAASRAMAGAAGMALIYRLERAEASKKTPKSLMFSSAEAGIPGITIEIGGQGRLDEDDVARAHQALLNVVKHLGMLEGAVLIPGPQHRVRKGHRLRSETGGVLWCKAKPLDRVKKGDVIQIITDLFGRERERLVAPVDGIIVAIRTSGMVNSGEYCSNIGELDKWPIVRTEASG